MRRLIMALAALCAVCASAADPKPALPDWFPDTSKLFKVEDLGYSDYDLWDFLVLDESPIPKNSGGYRVVTGRVWKFTMADKAPAAWKALRSQLEQRGFKLASGDPADDDPGMTALQKGEAGHATYVEYWNRNAIAIIEDAPNPYHVKLEPPAAKPEKFGVHDDIPYLTPIAGSKTTSAENDLPTGLMVSPACGKPGGDKVPDESFGTRHSERAYDGPATISGRAIQEAYASALREAGWDQVCMLAGVGELDAHYTRNGRDIWMRLRHPGEPRRYEFHVADAGSALRLDLKKSCKAALYGVNFDFDKATLRPDAEPALNQVLALMKDEPKLAVEIGGHTDNVGKPDYNMKLSDARAAAVVRWLVQHGIAASRLSSHGYGDTQPLAKNDSDENRARNRRVELKRKGCK